MKNYTLQQDRVHKWLYYHYGKAEICENRESNVLDFDCRENCEIYDWANIDGEEYRKDRDCFYQLCRSCHSRYDGCGFFESGEKHPMYGKTPANKSEYDTCQVAGCDRGYHGRNMCSKHYGQWYRGKINQPKP